MNPISKIHALPQSIIIKVVNYLPEKDRPSFFELETKNQRNIRIFREIKLNPNAQQFFDEATKVAVKGCFVLKLYPFLTKVEAFEFLQKSMVYSSLSVSSLLKQERSTDYFIQMLIYACENGLTFNIRSIMSSGVLKEQDINYAIDLIFFNDRKSEEYQAEGEYVRDLSLFIRKKTCDHGILCVSFVEVLKAHKLSQWKFQSILEKSKGELLDLALEHGQVYVSITEAEKPKKPFKVSDEQKSCSTAKKMEQFRQKHFTLKS